MKIFIVFIISIAAFAQNNAVLTGIASPEGSGIFKNFSLRTVIGYESNFYESQFDNSQGATLEAFLGYKINEGYRMQLFISGEKGFTQGRQEITRDSRLSIIGKTYSLIKDRLVLIPSIIGVIPTSESSKDDNSLQTALELSPIFSLTINKFLNFTYIPRFRKNVHEFETNSKGEFSTDYSLLHFMFLSWAISDKLSFNPGLIYVNSWGYDNNKKADAYLSLLELSYSVDPKNVLSLGVRNSGELVDNERGKDQELTFLNEETSVAYLNYSYQF